MYCFFVFWALIIKFRFVPVSSWRQFVFLLPDYYCFNWICFASSSWTISLRGINCNVTSSDIHLLIGTNSEVISNTDYDVAADDWLFNITREIITSSFPQQYGNITNDVIEEMAKVYCVIYKYFVRLQQQHSDQGCKQEGGGGQWLPLGEIKSEVGLNRFNKIQQ